MDWLSFFGWVIFGLYVLSTFSNIVNAGRDFTTEAKYRPANVLLNTLILLWIYMVLIRL